MVLASFGPNDIRRRVRGEGIGIRTGPFAFRIRSDIRQLADSVAFLYSNYPLTGEGEFVDFEVNIARGGGLRRWIRPQARFLFDGEVPFEPLPVGHAMPLLEWSMNWCISTQAHQYLMLHAAGIERNGAAVLLPAPPGSGKSTLCAGLACRGWRLLSDELTLISPEDLTVHALCRPISLKNQSLAVIRNFEPAVEFSAVTHDTAKGSVAHMKIPQHHIDRISQAAKPRWVVFPKYLPSSPARLTPRSRADSLIELARNSFNYSILGKTGFMMLADVLADVECFDFEYSSLDEAVAVFGALAAAG